MCAYGVEGTAAKEPADSIHMFMHPQALIIDGSDAEEAWFQKPVRLEAPGYQMPVVEVPAGGVQSLKWMVKLDSASLKGKKMYAFW
jgi:hypothetical protein